jgi:oligosaccharide reducing-end xylanase
MQFMKTAVFLLFSVLCLHFPSFGQAAVETWRRSAKGAMSITWDDNEPTQFTTAVPLMNRYDIRGTFFIVTDNVKDWETIRSAALDGHEIGSHTVSHAYFDELDADDIEFELRRSKEIIDSQVTSQRCVSHAYPFCQFTKAEAMARKYYAAARGCGAGMAPDTGKTIEATTPENLFNVAATHCDRESDTATAEMQNRYVNKLLESGGWLVTLYHGIDSVGYQWLYADTFELHLEHIVFHNYELFIAPFGEVVRYVRERDCATLTKVSESKTEIVYALSDTLSDDETFNYPLTCRTIMPAEWQFAIVIQGEAIKWSETRNDTILFDAVPDRGDIRLVRFDVRVGQTLDTRRIGLPALPLGGGSSLYGRAENSDAAVTVYSLDGRRARRLNLTRLPSPGKTADTRLRQPPRGVYVAEVKSGEQTAVFKLPVF